MARTCLMSERQVQYALALLVKCHIIAKKERSGLPTLYTLQSRKKWVSPDKVTKLRNPRTKCTPAPDAPPTPAPDAPLPPHPMHPPGAYSAPEGNTYKVIQKGDPSTARTNGARRRNEFSDAFCTAYAVLHPDELAYKPLKKDFVQLAALRNEDKNGWMTVDRWQRAVDNYFASNIGNPTLADLSTRFRVFYKSKLDKYGKPVIEPAVPVKLQGCDVCLNDAVRVRTNTDPGWRFDTTLKSFVPCGCNPIAKGNVNGKPQEQRSATASQQ